MTDEFLKKLKDYGVNTDETFRRFMGNTDMYEKFLRKFSEDRNYSLIGPALEKNDFNAALEAAHSVKGVAANLGLDPLAKACSETVRLIREGKNEEARKSYPAVEKEYADTMRLIGN
jgi:HPt (histidine-containing phosphotransfer) domain-containing protein